MADIPEVITRMTLEEFQRLPESGAMVELINGELIVSPSPVDDHQKLVIRWIIALEPLLDGGELRTAPADVYLDPVNAVQPDLFWIGPTNETCVLIDGY